MNPVSFTAVRSNPEGCCKWLRQSGAVSYFDIDTMAHTVGITVFDAKFVAPEGLPDYPVEHARISVLADSSIAAVPVGCSERTWYHRFRQWPIAQIIIDHPSGPLPWLHVVGGLCLWYPGDPKAWRWTWDDGFDTYLLLVQRHLWAEEYSRRHGHWPVEDAPHGERSDGRSHPLPPLKRRSA
jgi:hypothetical protein